MGNTAYVYMVRPLQGGVTVKISNTPSVTTPTCVITALPPTEIGINGVACVEINKAYSFSVNPEKSQVSKVNWWSNGGGTVTVDPTNSANVSVVFPANMNGSTTTLFAGVNFSVSPWYKEYTKTIKIGSCPAVAPSTVQARVAERIEVYPQPFDESTLVSTENNSVINTIEVFNTSGILVDRVENINVTNYRLGANLSSGIYIVHVHSNEQVSVVKLLKK